MKIKCKFSKSARYNEIGQRNSLRWRVMFLDDKTQVFHDQSDWMKCKDFFNDIVAFLNKGSKFSIYGFDNAIKTNADGVYMLLKFVNDKPTFLANLAVVNNQLKADLDCEVWAAEVDEQSDEVMIWIPPALWKSTYQISLITFVIRLCNYGYQFTNWKSIWETNSPAQQQESAFSSTAIKNALRWGFKVPGKFSKYWFYAGESYNSEKAPETTGTIIHNNGCTNWAIFTGEVKP